MSGDFRFVFMPYCIKRQENGKYAVLNRRYKPVGFTISEHIKYEEYPVLVDIRGLTPAKASKISFKGDPDTDTIYLYNDGCVPTSSADNMRRYLSRLALLAGLKVF